MRSAKFQELVTRIDGEVEVTARGLMVEQFGPSCAAWLVFEHRRMLHRRGVFDAVIPVGIELPMWFSIAVGFLRRRPGWSVDVLEHSGQRLFRIRWHSWPHWGAMSKLLGAIQ